MAANYSQRDAAKAIGMSPQALSSWERGDRMPTATQLGALAFVYGQPIDYVVTGVRTIPMAMLRAYGDEACINMSKLMAGFRGLVQAWVRA